MKDDGSYYGKDGMVWKSPVRKNKEGGGYSISIGFPICKMHDAVGEDAAASVAALMNLGDCCVELATAAEKVMAGLNARIEQADPSAVPVFDGIAELFTALNKAQAIRTAADTDADGARG